MNIKYTYKYMISAFIVLLGTMFINKFIITIPEPISLICLIVSVALMIIHFINKAKVLKEIDNDSEQEDK